MTDLTEKNLEAVLLNLTKTDRPITIKPTTCFGNPAKTAQWYTCPNCAKPSPLTLEWVGLTDEEITELHHEIKVRLMGTFDTKDIYRAVEQALKEKNT